ncbi:hypothetical protein AACW90_02160 [Vibrio sp. F74]
MKTSLFSNMDAKEQASKRGGGRIAPPPPPPFSSPIKYDDKLKWLITFIDYLID